MEEVRSAGRIPRSQAGEELLKGKEKKKKRRKTFPPSICRSNRRKGEEVLSRKKKKGKMRSFRSSYCHFQRGRGEEGGLSQKKKKKRKGEGRRKEGIVR